MYDAAGKAGLAEVTHRVMRTGGTKDLSGDELDDRLDAHGISLSFSTDMETGSAHLSLLRKDLEQGLDIFAEILRRPRFAKEKLDLAKDLMIESLRGIQDDPPRFAFREFRKLLYHGNPRGNLYTIASVRSIAQSDVIAFHQLYIHPGNIMLAISGDINASEAIRLIRQRFNDWQAARKAESIAAPAVGQNHAIHILNKPITQSVVVAGNLAPSRQAPDYYAFTLLDFILGSGGFRSRIFKEIRNDRGLAYSTGSFFKGRRDYGAFGAYALTRSESTATVLALLLEIIEDAGRKGIAEQELSWAKNSINNNFIFSFQSTDQIVSQQMMLEFDGMPQDFLKRYPERISLTTATELQKAAQSHLERKKAVVLVLGNEEAFEKPLSGMGNVIWIQGN